MVVFRPVYQQPTQTSSLCLPDSVMVNTTPADLQDETRRKYPNNNKARTRCLYEWRKLSQQQQCLMYMLLSISIFSTGCAAQSQPRILSAETTTSHLHLQSLAEVSGFFQLTARGAKAQYKRIMTSNFSNLQWSIKHLELFHTLNQWFFRCTFWCLPMGGAKSA